MSWKWFFCQNLQSRCRILVCFIAKFTSIFLISPQKIQMPSLLKKARRLIEYSANFFWRARAYMIIHVIILSWIRLLLTVTLTTCELVISSKGCGKCQSLSETFFLIRTKIPQLILIYSCTYLFLPWLLG